MGRNIPGISILPYETTLKFQNMPQILTFQITLSLQVNFHLALRKQREKKKSEISEKRKISKEKKNLKFRSKRNC